MLLQVFHLRQGALARMPPVVIAEHGVDTKSRRTGAEPAERPVQHVAEAALVVDAIGPERRAVRIDVVAQHYAEITPRAAAVLVHRPGDRVKAARRQVGAECALEGPRRRRESIQRRVALEPVPEFGGVEVAERPQRRLLVVGAFVGWDVAAVAEDDDRQ
jgi:hypothetical protein